MASDEVKSRSVFVGNLAYDLTEEALANHMRRAGPVVSARIVYDKSTGRSKGFGFVEFANVATAKSAARDLADSRLYDRHLRIHVPDGEDPRKNRRRVDIVLDEIQQLTVDELMGLSPALRAQLLAMIELIKTLEKDQILSK